MEVLSQLLQMKELRHKKKQYLSKVIELVSGRAAVRKVTGSSSLTWV